MKPQLSCWLSIFGDKPLTDSANDALNKISAVLPEAILHSATKYLYVQALPGHLLFKMKISQHFVMLFVESGNSSLGIRRILLVQVKLSRADHLPLVILAMNVFWSGEARRISTRSYGIEYFWLIRQVLCKAPRREHSRCYVTGAATQHDCMDAGDRATQGAVAESA